VKTDFGVFMADPRTVKMNRRYIVVPFYGWRIVESEITEPIHNRRLKNNHCVKNAELQDNGILECTVVSAVFLGNEYRVVLSRNNATLTASFPGRFYSFSEGELLHVVPPSPCPMVE